MAADSGAILAAVRALPREERLPFGPIAGGRLIPADPAVRLERIRKRGLAFLMGATEDDSGPGSGKEGPMAVGARTLARAVGGERSWLYHFAHPLPGSGDGAFHSSELWYTFGTYPRCWRPMGPEDRTLSERMVGCWTDFIKNGDPGWGCYAGGEIMEFQ